MFWFPTERLGGGLRFSDSGARGCARGSGGKCWAVRALPAPGQEAGWGSGVSLDKVVSPVPRGGTTWDGNAQGWSAMAGSSQNPRSCSKNPSPLHGTRPSTLQGDVLVIDDTSRFSV